MIARSPRVWLIDIREEVAGIQGLTKGVDLGAFSASWGMKRAVEHALLIIAEAAKHLPQSMKDARPEVPWSKIHGLAPHRDFQAAPQPHCRAPPVGRSRSTTIPLDRRGDIRAAAGCRGAKTCSGAQRIYGRAAFRRDAGRKRGGVRLSPEPGSCDERQLHRRHRDGARRDRRR
jgi:hypothetical protein